MMVPGMELASKVAMNEVVLVFGVVSFTTSFVLVFMVMASALAARIRKSP